MLCATIFTRISPICTSMILAVWTLPAVIPEICTLTEGLYYLQGTVFREEDIGKELALLSCEEGFWILGFVGGGGA